MHRLGGWEKIRQTSFPCFFAIDILLQIHLNNIKTLSPGTDILGVPGKNIKRNS